MIILDKNNVAPESLPELTGGFNYYSDKRPVNFTLKVPGEGNFKVRVEFKVCKASEDVFLFLNRRRLAFHAADCKAGQVFVAEGIVNVCPIIPRGMTTPVLDLNIYGSLIGRELELIDAQAEPWEGRTIYIAGDSTVTDQTADYPYYSAGSYCGWGQMLGLYLQNEFAVSNHAHSGLTTESFREEGHYDILFERIKAGDYCLLQFGHNDQKLDHLKAQTGYRENLIRYIDEIRGKGANPVLVTPLARNSWRGGGGGYNDLLEANDAECKRIGKEYDVPVLMLHDMCMSFVKKLGMESAKRYFFPLDFTHSNDYGGYLFASYVHSELARCGICKAQSLPAWEPGEDVFEKLPKETAAKCAPVQDFFKKIERPQDFITRVEAFEFVAAAMRFFPTNVYNDMFSDVIGHETYAGIVECSHQNGLIPNSLIDGDKIHPNRLVTGVEFIEILLCGYSSRKSLPKEGAAPLENARLLGLVGDAFDAQGNVTRQAAAQMCDMIHI